MKKLSKITVVLAAIAMILGTSVISCTQGDETGENKSGTGTEENTGSSEETQAFSLANTHWFYETTSMRYDAITMNGTSIYKGFGYISFEDATSGKSYALDEDALFAAYKEFEETKTSGIKDIPYSQIPHYEFTYTINGTELIFYIKVTGEDGAEKIVKVKGYIPEDKIAFSQDVIYGNESIKKSFKKLKAAPKNAKLEVTFLQ